MSIGVKRSLPLLELLKDSNSSVRDLIISKADAGLIDTIIEICFNYLRGNIKCSKKHFKELSKHRDILRKIVKTRLDGGSSNKRKHERDILLQNGNGFWTALLTPLTKDLTSYFASRALER